MGIRLPRSPATDAGLLSAPLLVLQEKQVALTGPKRYRLGLDAYCAKAHTQALRGAVVLCAHRAAAVAALTLELLAHSLRIVKHGEVPRLSRQTQSRQLNH